MYVFRTFLLHPRMLTAPEIVCRLATDTGDVPLLRVVARAELNDTLFTSLFQKIVRICVSEFGLRKSG